MAREQYLSIAALTSVVLALAHSPIPAYAHASLSPRTSTHGQLEVYQLVVFGERNAPTVEVELILPKGIEVQGVEPTVGWTHDFVRNSSGTVSNIVWKGSLNLGGQVELRFVAKNVGGEGLYAFKALQRYADSEVAEWDYAGMRVEVKARTEVLTFPMESYLAIVLAIVTSILGLIFLKRRAGGKR